ncbi:hypothetical protein [Actinophytocola sp.]|uniref:hypothetical protein n=1 Tax=Actinophytocola sp. TaxID=1872138 RepID=UPI002D68E69B|nr:hypothetical protein [Actinophytocola sp.]HYQ69650.1 hypothetical protein [Actinophytocola sp.]
MADLVYGPHCNHDDLCSMFGCDQRGHIDSACKNQATCPFCHPAKPCPMDSSVSAADCPDCRVEHGDVATPPPADGGVVSPAGPVKHEEYCDRGDDCVECGGCDCGLNERVCEGPGCQSVDDHDQWMDENGDREGCSYGCH